MNRLTFHNNVFLYGFPQLESLDLLEGEKALILTIEQGG